MTVDDGFYDTAIRLTDPTLTPVELSYLANQFLFEHDLSVSWLDVIRGD